MVNQNNLLDKYYKGESSLEEERELKTQFRSEEKISAEKDVFEYFERESIIPDDMEESIFNAINKKNRKSKSLRVRLFSISSAAAAILIFLAIYVDIRDNRNSKMESDFFVMEHALFQISQSIQPEEMDDMLVLWVDDDVEIIIN